MSHIHAANKERKREKLIVGMIVYLLLDGEKTTVMNIYLQTSSSKCRGKTNNLCKWQSENQKQQYFSLPFNEERGVGWPDE